MQTKDRIKHILNRLPVFGIGLLAGSSLLSAQVTEWYQKDAVLPLFFAALAILGGSLAAKAMKSVNPALLMILSAGVLIVNCKGAGEIAFLFSLALWAMLAAEKRNWLLLAAGSVAGYLPDFGLDIRFRLLLWGWLFVLPTLVTAWREFLHYRTWGAVLLCGGLLMLLPLAENNRVLFPQNGILPVLLLPDAENLRIAFIIAPGQRENISQQWEAFPFVRNVSVGTIDLLRKTTVPFDLIVFYRLPGHSAAAREAALKLALKNLSSGGALVFNKWQLPEHSFGEDTLPVPGTFRSYLAYSKSKKKCTLSEMDKRLQTHLQNCGMENSFMPPGVFKALFYEDVYSAISIPRSRDWSFAVKTGGLAALLWVLFTLFRTGLDGSVWGNGCWFGFFSAVLFRQCAALEISCPEVWFWLPVILLTGFLARAVPDHAARYILSVSVILPLFLLPEEQPFLWLAAAFAAACSSGILQGTLAERKPEKTRELFCKYAAGGVGGVLAYCAIEIIMPGERSVVFLLPLLLRLLTFFRF
ncbi:MAG: hypothetical protein IJW17_10740 [Lentisphaeria bacterium]|nr:hypothetical protein [Lentisphaeria bacterium]